MHRAALILLIVIANHILLSEVQAGSKSSVDPTKGVAHITVEFGDDGVRIMGRAEHRPSGSGAQIQVAHRAPSVDPTPVVYPSTPSAAPSGYWAQMPIVCPKCGQIKGYRQVWLRWCANCQRYHE